MKLRVGGVYRNGEGREVRITDIGRGVLFVKHRQQGESFYCSAEGWLFLEDGTAIYKAGYSSDPIYVEARNDYRLVEEIHSV